MPFVTPEESMKLMYAAFITSNAKPDMNAIADFMGLKKGTAAARYNTLMSKLQDEFGFPGSVLNTTAPKNGGGGDKRKQGKQPKKTVGDAEERGTRGADRGETEPATKKAKQTEGNEVEDDEVSVKEETKKGAEGVEKHA